jgi:formamidopyrimidine-DNA glycosylase
MLGINLTGDTSIVFHLKMTGQLIYVDGKDRLIGGHPTEDMRDRMPNKSTVVIFEFSDSSHLYFNDQRRFGWVKMGDDVSFENVGPEPLDENWTWQALKESLLKHPKMPVKVAVMDQSVVAGVGNIYASEALFLAGIDPRRKNNSLSDEEFKKLHNGIVESLEISIKHGGTTIRDYVDAAGRKGGFLAFANVYGKEGLSCPGKCGGKVEKITQAGRSTYFCPECQK